MNGVKKNANPSPWKFFGLTFLLTWALWIPAGLDALEQFGILRKNLHYSGGVMPMLIALYLLYRYNDSCEQKNYWRSLKWVLLSGNRMILVRVFYQKQ